MLERIPRINTYGASIGWLLIGLFVIGGGSAFVAQGVSPFWASPVHDELHFFRTIKQFSDNLGLQTLTHYEDLSPPLPFLLYALWGKLFGLNPPVLRIFSILIAISTYITFHRLIYIISGNAKSAFWLTLFLSINPYMLSLNVLIYTDMLQILLLLLSILAIIQERPLLLCLSTACALLTRQYHVFFLVGFGLYSLMEFHVYKSRLSLYMLAATIVSMLPLLLLFGLWKGPTPINTVRQLYTYNAFAFHINYLFIYIGLFAIYLFPVLAATWKRFYASIYVLVGSFLISFLYWLNPISPNEVYRDRNIDVIGFFHRFLLLIDDNKLFVDLVFYVAFLLGLPVVFFLVRDIYKRIIMKILDIYVVLDLLILSFLVVMPFSYLVWEKYFLPALVLTLLRMSECWESRPISYLTRSRA